MDITIIKYVASAVLLGGGALMLLWNWFKPTAPESGMQEAVDAFLRLRRSNLSEEAREALTIVWNGMRELPDEEEVGE